MAERAGKIIRRVRDFVGRRETRQSTLVVKRLNGEMADQPDHQTLTPESFVGHAERRRRGNSSLSRPLISSEENQ